MFKSTIITLLTLTVAFNAMAAPVPVQVIGVAPVAKRDTIEIREPVTGVASDAERDTIETREPGMGKYGGP
ncbi:hypothetical protein Vi05172_g1905 [Venturia inaequalis]|nr:hypothetical protein Vi05172_g1905 [Venturia inaequalis]